MKTKIARRSLPFSEPSMHESAEMLLPSFPYLRGEGCGNTFLIYDCLDASPRTIETVMTEAHDKLVTEKRDDALILKAEHSDAQKLILTMIVLEPDRSVAEFCGNGARVVCRYLQHKFGNRKMKYYLKTSSGLRRVWWEDNIYYVEMGKTNLHLYRSKFFESQLESFTLGLGMRQFTFFWTETLEPHLVTFDAIDEAELFDLGLYLNHHQRRFFPLGVNLNKAEITSERSLSVTTFERGVNRITAACGTGATSCVMLAKAGGRLLGNGSINVLLKGGSITIQPKGNGAIMSGPAVIDV